MNHKKLTILGDGPSDEALVPIVNWVIDDFADDFPYSTVFADHISRRGGALLERVRAALTLYPCDLLVVHRDSEGESVEVRIDEIHGALGGLQQLHVPVVPVRMTEAWLLGDGNAIRRASGNPNGVMPLPLPPRTRWDREPDPKAVLEQSLLVASGLNARRRRKFPVTSARRRVATLTSGFAHLRGLASFDQFDNGLRAALHELGVAGVFRNT